MTRHGPKPTAIQILRSEIQSDMNVARRMCQEVTELFQAHVAPRPTETLYASALLLHHFYSSTESMLERIAKTLDGDVPSSPDWHRQLLHRMQLDIQSVRPAVMSSNLIRQLDEYRRFRHVVRHVYENPLQENRMELLIDKLHDLMNQIEKEIEVFMQFLDELARNLSGDNLSR